MLKEKKLERSQKNAILADLTKKMVFLSGPRQAGKTTLAKQIATCFNSCQYLKFDSQEDKNIIKNQSWLPETELLIFDEIHKMVNWKNYLKGIFDTKPQHQKILVIGSANQVGDSLAGRYFLHRLMPLSIAELKNIGESTDLEHLQNRSGFPEPYLAESDLDAERWRLQYIDSLLQTDVLDFENIHKIKAIRMVFELLRQRVGSPISYTAIAEDVSIAPNTVKKYIAILEALYIVFRVSPFSKNIARSLTKEPKLYFFDVGLVKADVGAKFENLIAVSLLKHVYAKIDYLAAPYALAYLRNRDNKEVDFALINDNQLEQIIEVKNSNSTPSKGLYYFKKKYNLNAIQIVKQLRQPRITQDIKIISGIDFLQSLYL